MLITLDLNCLQGRVKVKSSAEMKEEGVRMAVPSHVPAMLQAHFVYKVNKCMLFIQIPKVLLTETIFAKCLSLRS